MKTFKMSIFLVLVSSIIFSYGCSTVSSHEISVLEIFSDTEQINNSGFGLLFFMAPQNCPPCLEGVDKLNELSISIPIKGIVSNITKEKLRSLKSRHAFPLEQLSKKYEPFLPFLSPSTVAISKKGKILMVLPGLPDQNSDIEKVIWELSAKAITIQD